MECQFEVRPCLERLTCEEKGALFEAMLDYAQYGALPQFEGALGVAWDFIRPKLDLDRERYEAKVEQARKAINKRWGKEDTTEYGRIPNTKPNSNTNSHSISNTDPYAREDDFNRRRNAALEKLADYS